MEPMKINEILKHIPHRYPFLLIDRVIEISDSGKRIVAIKNVSVNEHYFSGHFPKHPVMPGVLILEALSQAAAVACHLLTGEEIDENRPYYLAGINRVRFKRVIEPGDQLHLEVELLHHKQEVWQFKATAKVGAQVACSGELLFARKGVVCD